MKTKNLELIPQTPQHLLAMIEGKDVYERIFSQKLAEGIHDLMASGEVSQEFLAKLKNAPAADPWTFGYGVLLSAENLIIGSCGFKGPPGTDGIVEIAYGIAPGYCGRGFATEVAQALVIHALKSGAVRTVRAHTLPEPNASTRVLAKCGFRKIGEVTDPEDGLVWRWEHSASSDGSIPILQDALTVA